MNAEELLRKILGSPDQMLVYVRGRELVLDGYVMLTDEELAAVRALDVTEHVSLAWEAHHL